MGDFKDILGTQAFLPGSTAEMDTPSGHLKVYRDLFDKGFEISLTSNQPNPNGGRNTVTMDWDGKTSYFSKVETYSQDALGNVFNKDVKYNTNLFTDKEVATVQAAILKAASYGILAPSEGNALASTMLNVTGRDVFTADETRIFGDWNAVVAQGASGKISLGNSQIQLPSGTKGPQVVIDQSLTRMTVFVPGKANTTNLTDEQKKTLEAAIKGYKGDGVFSDADAHNLEGIVRGMAPKQAATKTGRTTS